MEQLSLNFGQWKEQRRHLNSDEIRAAVGRAKGEKYGECKNRNLECYYLISSTEILDVYGLVYTEVPPGLEWELKDRPS